MEDYLKLTFAVLFLIISGLFFIIASMLISQENPVVNHLSLINNQTGLSHEISIKSTCPIELMGDYDFRIGDGIVDFQINHEEGLKE